MCLYVDFNKTIDDNKTYTFYKLYSKVKKNRDAPLGLKYIYRVGGPKSVDLVAMAGNNKPLPAGGQDAYDKYAQESSWDFDEKGYPHTKINEGIHAYTSKANANKAFYPQFEKMVKVKVKGRHIIAFGGGEVAFTRGKIVGEVK